MKKIILTVMVFLAAFFSNYHFAPQEKRGRKTWLKEKRRKRRKRAKRPNRFRDYDF